MIVIGEKINATRGSIARAVEARDARAIEAAALEQVAAGADYLDVNGAVPGSTSESENLAWLIDVVRAATEVPICVDSADGLAMRAGLVKAGKKPILNSISLESARLESMTPLVAENDCMVVALLMSDKGTPVGVDDRLSIADELIKTITASGKNVTDIIIDPCFMPLSVDVGSGCILMDSIAAIRANWPEIHIAGGVSNASFGLPKRRHVNMALLVSAIVAGMDYGIIDPCPEGTMQLVRAAEVVAGRDELCMNYISAAREGKLD